MKQRLITALIVGGIAAGVGVGIAIKQNQQGNVIGIALATGIVGFVLGLLFKFRAI